MIITHPSWICILEWGLKKRGYGKGRKGVEWILKMGKVVDV
jgi:hypothetical protein